MYKRAPKGYRKAEFPLSHRFAYNFSLQGESSTKQTMIAPILRYSELANVPETINVNPSHPSFTEEAGCTCNPDSIIPRINFKLECTMAKVAIETDKMRSLRFLWYPIYTSFLEGLDSADRKTGTTVKAILELEAENTNRTTQPITANTDLGTWLHPLSNVNDPDEAGPANWGLLTDAKLEGIIWSESLMEDALNYYSNGNMLRTMMGRHHKPLVTRDRPYTYYSNNKTYPKVKRMNPHTFCGFMIHVYQASTMNQIFNADEVTVINHLNVKLQVQYDEWNQEFDQTAY